MPLQADALNYWQLYEIKVVAQKNSAVTEKAALPVLPVVPMLPPKFKKLKHRHVFAAPLLFCLAKSMKKLYHFRVRII
jgi:hypothetical protein